MIRLLAAWTRIAVVAVSMAMSIPAITFAQTPESATESEPTAGDNASPVQAASGPEDDTSVETNPSARSTIPSEVEAEIQRRINELRREQMDDRAGTVDWWLAALAVVLGFFGIVVVVGGYIGFTRFREIEAEAKNSAKDAAEHAKDAKRYIEEIERNRDESNKIVRGMNAQTVTDDPDDSGEANQAVKDVLRNPGASLIARAIANAISLQKRGKRDDAIEKWRAVAHVAEESDNDLAARAWFSVGYLRWDKNPEDCIFAYDQAIRLNPNLVAAYTNRGVAKHKLGRHEAALADHDEAIRLNPDYAAAYFNRGVAKHKLGRHEAALADHDEAIRLNPDYAAAYFNRGIAKHKLGRHEAALADHDEAIRLNPDYAAAYTNRGVAKHKLGRHEAALADHDEAIRLNPGLAEAYTNRGLEKHELGRHEAALTDHDEAIRLNPDLAEAYFNRGIAKHELGLKDDARKDFEIALELAQKANDAKIVAQAEQLLRDLDAAEDS